MEITNGPSAKEDPIRYRGAYCISSYPLFVLRDEFGRLKNPIPEEHQATWGIEIMCKLAAELELFDYVNVSQIS